MEQRQDPRKVLEQKYDPKLDRLYTRSVKCPYCGKKIEKLQSTCACCGLNKMQIANASGARAKEMIKHGERGKIVMMRRRPDDLKFVSIAWRLVFGIFGVHNFYTGRRIRGWIMLGLMTAFLIQCIIFPLGDINSNLVGMHPWRTAWNDAIGYSIPFPLDLLGVAALVLWFSDAFGIVFGWYKYPVRLGDAKKSA